MTARRSMPNRSWRCRPAVRCCACASARSVHDRSTHCVARSMPFRRLSGVCVVVDGTSRQGTGSGARLRARSDTLPLSSTGSGPSSGSRSAICCMWHSRGPQDLFLLRAPDTTSWTTWWEGAFAAAQQQGYALEDGAHSRTDRLIASVARPAPGKRCRLALPVRPHSPRSGTVGPRRLQVRLAGTPPDPR